MGYGFAVTGASGIDLGRVAAVRTEGKMVADKYIGGDAARTFANILDEMVGLGGIAQAFKSPVVGGQGVSDHGSAPTTGAQQNSGRGLLA